MKRARAIFCCTLLIALLCVVSCGRKGPPVLPERPLPLRVVELKAGWRSGLVELTGAVAGVRGAAVDLSLVEGCRVAHARYPLSDPPCEGCPIAYGQEMIIREQVVAPAGFRCTLRGLEGKGIYYFKVRLAGRKGVLGPPSEPVKFLVAD